MGRQLLQIVENDQWNSAQITSATEEIHRQVLENPKSLDGPNFTRINTLDVKNVFDAYDNTFFQGQIAQTLGTIPIFFSCSGRMTSSGGRTTRTIHRQTGLTTFEIRVSTAILYGCFNGDDHRPISASGILCRDRLSALQRIMEHEIVHLIELLLWDDSSCNHDRFHSISLRFFGHTENRHKFITPKEKAVMQYGVRPGMKARFTYEGVEYTGVVNRITKRATVLVEHPDGVPYSDGKSYLKFYVPPPMLKPFDAPR